MGKSLHDQNQEKTGTRESENKDFNTTSREGYDDNSKNLQEQLSKDDLPDSTNESTGNTGSGQRQDSN